MGFGEKRESIVFQMKEEGGFSTLRHFGIQGGDEWILLNILKRVI